MDQQRKELLEKWRQEVCLGDNVECLVFDAIHMMISNLNDHQLIKHPILSKVNQINLTEQPEICTDLICEISRVMIKAGLKKIYQIEKGR